MRDKNRIIRILNKIETIWIRNPDLRLGQLLYIFCGFQDTDYGTEDDFVEEKLSHWGLGINDGIDKMYFDGRTDGID